MTSSLETNGQPGLRGEASVDHGRRKTVHAWLAVAVAAAVVLVAAMWGPRPGDSVIWLVAQLVVIVALGLGAAIAALWFSVQALWLRRAAAVVPLIIGAFLVFQALLRVLGTLGRFYHWG